MYLRADAGHESYQERGGNDWASSLRAKVSRLEQELEALANEVSRWWSAPEADNSPADLQEGARLHDAIEARLVALEAARQQLATAGYGATGAEEERTVLAQWW